MSDTRLPVTLLTGFLGSGKTTLLNTWLRAPELENAAVVVNEFGEVGIDHALIASSTDNTIELSTGCLCCTVRGDLVDTLRELIVRREKGEVRQFDRLIIETTGLADPAPVIQAIMTFPVARRFRLALVVTTIDVVNGAVTFANHPESVKQAAVADEIILTKTDLCSENAEALSSMIRQWNGSAKFHTSSFQSPLLPSQLSSVDIYDPQTKSGDVVRWLNGVTHGLTMSHRHHTQDHDINRHSADITSFVFKFDEALHWEHVANWLDALVVGHGPDLLRVKGIFNIAGRDRPVVIQAVQSLFHPPFELSDWPAQRRESVVVFITRKLSRDFVAEVYETISRRAPVDSLGSVA